MKKIISLLLCLVLLLSCATALAASLAPEKVIGTWVMTKLEMDGTTYDKDGLEAAGLSLTLQFHPDGSGTLIVTDSTASKQTAVFDWSIDGNNIVMHQDGYENIFTLNGSTLVFKENSEAMYLTKTSDNSGKTVKKAITSKGTYRLNTSKKTAVFIGPANRKVSSLKIPDTIKVNGKTYKVTEIGAKACGGMTKLTTVTFGKNVKKIGKAAFTGCKKLRKLTFSGTALTSVGAGAFSDAKKTATVICPKKKVEKYKKLLIKGGLSDKAKFQGK